MSVTAPAAGAGTAPEMDVYIHVPHEARWQKSDLGANPATAVAASRANITSGDAHTFYGWSIRESTGAAAAQFRLRDGGATGEIIANANLIAGESVRDLFAPHGIRVNTGRIFLEVLAGSVEGVIYWL